MHHRSNASCHHVHAEGAGSYAAGRDQHINLLIRACERCRTRFVHAHETFCPDCVVALRVEHGKQAFAEFIVGAMGCFFMAFMVCEWVGVPREDLLRASFLVGVIVYFVGMVAYVWFQTRYLR